MMNGLKMDATTPPLIVKYAESDLQKLKRRAQRAGLMNDQVGHYVSVALSDFSQEFFLEHELLSQESLASLVASARSSMASAVAPPTMGAPSVDATAALLNALQLAGLGNTSAPTNVLAAALASAGLSAVPPPPPPISSLDPASPAALMAALLAAAAANRPNGSVPTLANVPPPPIQTFPQPMPNIDTNRLVLDALAKAAAAASGATLPGLKPATPPAAPIQNAGVPSVASLAAALAQNAAMGTASSFGLAQRSFGAPPVSVAPPVASDGAFLATKHHHHHHHHHHHPNVGTSDASSEPTPTQENMLAAFQQAALPPESALAQLHIGDPPLTSVVDRQPSVADLRPSAGLSAFAPNPLALPTASGASAATVAPTADERLLTRTLPSPTSSVPHVPVSDAGVFSSASSSVSEDGHHSPLLFGDAPALVGPAPITAAAAAASATDTPTVPIVVSQPRRVAVSSPDSLTPTGLASGVTTPVGSPLAAVIPMFGDPNCSIVHEAAPALPRSGSPFSDHSAISQPFHTGGESSGCFGAPSDGGALANITTRGLTPSGVVCSAGEPSLAKFSGFVGQGSLHTESVLRIQRCVV